MESEGASAPSAIRVLEDKTIAHGSGLLTVCKNQVLTDPWFISAVVNNGIKFQPVSADNGSQSEGL